MTTEHLIKVSDPAPIANGDIEAAFLGAALLDPLIAPLYLDVPSEAFYFQEHQIIWESMLYLAKQGKPVDLTSVRVTILDFKHPDHSGRLTQLLDSTTGAYNHDLYMSAILDKWDRRRTEAFSYRLGTIARDTKDPDWQTKGQLEFGGLLTRGAQSSGFQHASAFFDKAIAPIDSISTGIPQLDEAWGGGFANGNLITIAGRPGTGKSNFACFLALSLAKRGNSVAFASVEMTASEVLQRWMGALLQVDYSSIRARGCNGDPRIEKARGYVGGLPLFVDDETSTAGGIVSKTIAASQQVPIKLLIIDHLHRIFPGTDPATIDAANKAVSGFKTLAKRLDIPVVMLCQLNKGLEARTDKRPTLSDLSLFNAIERESDMVCGVYREEYYNKDTADCGITEIVGMKNRHGSARNIKLLSNMGHCNYAEMPDEY